MKHFTRMICLLLATLCVCTTACARTEEVADTTTQATTTTAATSEAAQTEPPETTVKKYPDDLPDDLRFDGRTFSVYVGSVASDKRFFGGPEEESGDLIKDSVFTRNLLVEERLGIELQSTAVDNSYNEIYGSLSTLVLAGDQSYDLFVGQQYGMTLMVAQQLLLDVYELDDINFEQPWWDNDYMEELSLGIHRRYLLSGDYFLTVMELLDVLYFNKEFYKNEIGDPDEFYQRVLDGDWLLEDMHKLTESAYADLNGNGTCDFDDRYGFVAYKLFATTDPFVYGSNVTFTTRDQDGYIELNLAGNEKAANLLEDLLAFFYQDAVMTDGEVDVWPIFTGGRALFIGGNFQSMSGGLAGMEQDFAPLVYPKSEAEQESYHTVVHDTAYIGGIPKSTINTDIIGAVLEALSSESYRTVYPNYFETSMKIKYARDSASAQMVDLLKETKTTNFIFAYCPSLGHCGHIFRELISGNSSHYASSAKARQKMTEKMLDDLIESYENNP